MTRPGIEPWSPRTLANTLLIRPMAWSSGKQTIQNDNTQNFLKLYIKDNLPLKTPYLNWLLSMNISNLSTKVQWVDNSIEVQEFHLNPTKYKYICTLLAKLRIC